MRTVSPTGTAVAVGSQVLLVVFSGLILAWLIGNMPVALVLGAVGAGILCLVFLRRPELGLLIVLLVGFPLR